MKYGLSCFLGLHVKALSLTHVLACYCEVFASTSIGVHSSILIMMVEGLKNFVGIILVRRDIGAVKGNRNVFFFHSVIVNNIARKIISVFESHIKVYCVCF